MKESEYSMPYARYINVNWEKQVNRSTIGNIIDIFTKKWHFFTGVPTVVKLEGKGRLTPSAIRKRKYIKTIHYGPYQKIGDTYKKMFIFSQENNLKLENESIEYYTNDPSKVEKANIQTEVLIGIK